MKRNLSWLERVMLAVTFAEAGCPELAGDYAAVGKSVGQGRDCQGAEGCPAGRGLGAVRQAAGH